MEYIQSVFPYFQRRPQLYFEPFSGDEAVQTYLMKGENFSKLCDAKFFQENKSRMIEVDIQDECQHFSHDNFLEIIVPILNVCDLKASSGFFASSVLHPSVMVVNGWGAGNAGYPNADFIRVWDIADNRYEAVVASDGELEIPQDGFGLYTIIKEVTYLFTHRQIIEGVGLCSLESVGAVPGKIYLLPPLGTSEQFLFYICVTKITPDNRRIVDSIRPVEVHCKIKSNCFEPSRLKAIYPEVEYMRDFLMGKGPTFFSHRGYNNFLLRPETFSRLYESMIHDLAYGYLDKAFLQERLDQAHVAKLKF